MSRPRQLSRPMRLRRIAEEIEARGADITEIGTRGTGLPEARLEGERGRTCGRLRLVADHIEAGDSLDRRHDPALPDRVPLPRPDLRRIQRPVGPVAVFGASNFPLAFLNAGGDTASALAAGRPVVVKGHSARPGVGDIVAQAIVAARRASCVPGRSAGSRAAIGRSVSRRSSIQPSRRWDLPALWEVGVRSSIFARPGPSRSRSSAGSDQSIRLS